MNVIENIIKETKSNPISIKIKELLSEKYALILEVKLIKIIGRRNIGLGPLTNLSDGGDGGGINRKYSLEGALIVSIKTRGVNNFNIENRNIENFRIYELISPTGEKYIVKNLKEFCRNNNLHNGKLYDLLNNKVKYYKGWSISIIQDKKHKTFPLKYNGYYRLIDTHGKEYTTNSIIKFCEEFNLRQSGFIKILKGVKKLYLGWQCFKLNKIDDSKLTNFYKIAIRKNPKHTPIYNYYLTDPNGVRSLLSI